MRINELAEQLRVPGEYVGYLFSIVDGTETQYTEEDAQEAKALEEQLSEIELDGE